MRAGQTSLRWAAIAALALAITACGESDPTQLVVRVESDLAVPAQLDRLVVRVDGNDECGDECLREIPLAEPGALPLSFGVAPRGGDVRRRVRLVVEGRLGEATVVSRTVETGFVPDEVRLLVVRLEAACAARAPCEPDLTCAGGACVPEDVDVLELPRIAPGEELARDAGAGGDGGGATPRSCEGLPDGPRTIDPDGPGAASGYETWCESGWTLLLKADGDAPGLGYDVREWEMADAAPFGTTRPDARENAMLESYWRLPVRRLRFVASDGVTAPRALEVPIEGLGAAAPLAEVMRAGDATTGGDVAQWGALIGVSFPAGTVVCARSIPALVPEGAPIVRVRLGVALGEDASCSPVLGWAGVGASTAPQSDMQCTTFTHTAGGARLCGSPPSLRTDRRLFVVVYGHD